MFSRRKIGLLCFIGVLVGLLANTACTTTDTSASGERPALSTSNSLQASGEGTVFVVNSLAFADELLLEEHVQKIGASSDGRRFALGHRDGSLRLVSRDGEILSDSSLHEAAITAVAFVGPDLILFGGADGMVGVGSVGEDLSISQRHSHLLSEYPINTLITHEETGNLISIDGRNRIRVSMGFSEGPSTFVELPNAWRPNWPKPTFHPEGERFALVNSEAQVEIYDLEGLLVSTLELPRVTERRRLEVCGLSFHESGVLEMLMGSCSSHYGSTFFHVVFDADSEEILFSESREISLRSYGFTGGYWWFLYDEELEILRWDGHQYERNQVAVFPYSSVLHEMGGYLALQGEERSILDLRDGETLFRASPSPFGEGPRLVVPVANDSWAIATEEEVLILDSAGELQSLGRLTLDTVWSDGATLVGHAVGESQIRGVFRLDIESREVLWHQEALSMGWLLASNLLVSPDFRWVVYGERSTEDLIVLDGGTGEMVRRIPGAQPRSFEGEHVLGVKKDPDTEEWRRITFALPQGQLEERELTDHQWVDEWPGFEGSRVRFTETDTQIIFTDGQVIGLPTAAPTHSARSQSGRYLLLRLRPSLGTTVATPTRVHLYDLKERVWQEVKLPGIPWASAFTLEEDRILTTLLDRRALAEWSVEEALQNPRSF